MTSVVAPIVAPEVASKDIVGWATYIYFLI